MKALILPAPLQRPVERFARGFIQPPGRPPVDFSAPAGAPSLLPSDSLSLRIFKNPLALAAMMTVYGPREQAQAMSAG
ncbi:MAG: hypothetical protein WAQ08_02860 [Aquabacterium sp.]|jgi:hypothetical protein|uniref:hypothetical protein n=1 Tax=Aquabacterium sp. TaxID=1872578 RepID=UPI003BAFA443